MATDPYNPLAPRAWNPAVPDWMNIAYGANRPQAPTFTPEVIDQYHWGKVRARTGYDTAPPERQRAIRNEYATRALPEVARLTGADLAQMEAAFRASNPDTAPATATVGDDGDFMRGVKSYWPGTKASVYGLGALAADLVGADDTAQDWAQRAQALHQEMGASARSTDSLSGAWGSGDGVLGTTGNLLDWAQYNVGQMLPSVVESLVTAAAGAAAGSEVPVLGNITGAIAGLLGKTAIKKELRERTAALVAEHAAKRIAAGTAEAVAKREAADLGQQFLTRTLQREIGSLGALATSATARGLGDTYNAAYTQAQETGEDIDLTRVLAGGAVYGAAETFGDKVLADTLLKGVGGSGGLARRMATGFGKNALTEGTTEAVQQAAQRFGAAQSLTDGEALTEYLDSFAAGAIGGGVYGAAGGFVPGSAPALPAAAPTSTAPAAVPAPVPPASAPTPTSAPAVPAGIDPDTGEVQTPPPAPEAVMTAIHGFLDGWQGDKVPTRGDVRRFVETTYPGLSAARMNPLIDQVRAQRKAQATPARAPGAVDPAEQAARMRMQAQIAQARPVEDSIDLPRVQVGPNPDSWTNQNAQAARDQADRMGITATMEALFATGLTAKQVKVHLAEALAAIPNDERASFVVQVRATLGIPSRMTAEGQQEFDAWLAQRNARTRTQTAQARQAADEVDAIEAETAANDAARLDTSPSAPDRESPALQYDTREEMQDADIGTPSGGPFTIEDAARRAAGRIDGGRVFAVEGGFVVRTPRSSPQVEASAPAAAADTTAASTPTATADDALVVMETVYGDKVRVRRRDLDSDRTLLPLYTREGKRYAELPIRPRSVVVHRHNLDADGSKRRARVAAEGGLPYYARIKRRGKVLEVPFKTAQQARDAVVRDGASMDDYTLVERAGGFIAVRKARAPEANAAKGEETSDVDAAAHAAATSPQNDLPAPTEAQIEAGNFRMGHVRINGMQISIEHPAGAKRHPQWAPLAHHYGYIKGTVGKDKARIDVFLTEQAKDTTRPVFVVDQNDTQGRFDEHKVILGAATEDEARQVYLRNYPADWTGLGAITRMTQAEFKTWVFHPEDSKRPAYRAQVASRGWTPARKAHETVTGRRVAAGKVATQARAEGDPTDAPTNNDAILMDFVDTLVAQVQSGRAGRVEFPAKFEHVTEVEHALRALRTAFEQAGATNSGGRFGARYAMGGGIVNLSNSSHRLWADVQIDPRASQEPQPLPSAAPDAQNGSTSSRPQEPDAAVAANEEDTPDAASGQSERLSARRARKTAGDVVADRAGDREPLDAGLAQTGAAADRGELLPGGAGGPDRAGNAGEDGHQPEPSVELGEGAGLGAVAGAADLGLRGGVRQRRGRRGRGRVNGEAAAIDDPAASSVEADAATPQAVPAALPDAVVSQIGDDVPVQGLADDLGKGGLARKARDNLAAIRIVQLLEAEHRVATPEERRQLARYVGWGALKGVFDPANAQWAKIRTELQGLLTDAEWRAARASTLNAHYTSKPVIDGMVAGLARLGVTRGRILEPAVGIGHFFGGLPARLRQASDLFGIELDPLTQRIAAALYPDATIRQSGFQDVAILGEFFDVAIGNPPFGSEPIVDPERSPYSGFSIHNYFFAKSIDKLRPGGVLMMVVSRQFLDAKDSRARQWIAERADLIGAVRLPRTAFAANAGTEVVTDIIVLQKRAAETAPQTDEDIQAALRWVQTAEQTLEHPTTGESMTFRVNPYFLDHPDHVLGTPSASGSMYRANEYTVEPSGDLAEQLRAWAGRLPEGLYTPIDRTEAMTDTEVPEGTKVGAYFVAADGRIHVRSEDRMGMAKAVPWAAPTATAEARVRGMIELRNVLRAQMRLERSADATTTAIEANRRTLNDRYDTFLKRYGHLNASRTNRSLFFDDPDASLLLALEFDYDAGISETVAKREGVAPRAPKATKADIFQRRVLFPPSDHVTVANARDALVASLNYRGRLDPDYMTEIYGQDRAAIVAELGALVFETPDGALVTADDYLSGDVKTKLTEAKDAAQRDPRYARNVEALTQVIPRDKTPSEITIALGAPFLPVEDLRAFHREITGADANMTYSRGSGLWFVRVVGEPDPVRNTATWGTKDMTAADIFQATLVGRAVVVTKTYRRGDGSTQTVVLEAETEQAREKQNALRAEWRAWVWRDPERAERLLALYNEKMNRTVERRFDGRHLTLPGMSPGLTLLQHQQNGVWRGLQSRQLLLDHVVGAGKTFQMVAIAMEMRRLGIARKPLFAVPNHLTVQWRTEFARLYPGAVVLAAEPDDFTRENRKKLFSRIVTGDWDAVIVGHSSLKKIGLPEATETRILQEQVDEIAGLIEAMKRERGDKGIVREMEGIRARLEAKIKQKQANIGQRDEVLTFDELGVDALFVDELHEFKNLFYTTAMSRVPGMGNPNGSDRAFDLFVKTQWLFETFGDKAPIVTATGTPVSNSLVEMFNLQRYMQYPTLKRQDLHVFDAWARQYGSIENVYEVAPSGAGFRASTRFAKFQNLPSLMAGYRAFADVVTLDDLKAQEAAKGGRFPVPKLLGGKPQIVVAERSPRVSEFMGVPHLARSKEGAVEFGFNPGAGETTTIEAKDDGRFEVKIAGGPQARYLGIYPTREEADMAVVEAALTPQIDLNPESILGRFARIRELTRQTKGKVNALSLTGQANKAGLDYRLIDPTAPDFPGSKINLAVERMLGLYRQWHADKGTQLVFCDLSVPSTARKAAATKPQRVYIRDDDGSLIHTKGTAHTVAEMEELPFLLIERMRKGQGSVAVYDAATGRLRSDGHGSRESALFWAQQTLRSDDGRQQWLAQREAEREAGQALSQAEIDDYNDANAIDTEASPTLDLQDIVGLSGAAGFSVYDDLRAKLIAGGVPAEEIAFIHDYGNPDAKAKLFKRVNLGEVRFLFGSTPKIGAGTNVQKRIVGLHHIDAPWKPSDLEQREGRAIRRGNQLYERDPDGFEVAIYRYATRQTYDTRRWQLLEHKARGIEQLRKYDGQQTEIEDIDGEAANAAEMKAAASGDPLILRETQLRNEVRRLEQLELAHADNQTAFQQQARSAEEYAQTSGERRLKALRAMALQAAKHPLPNDKEAVPGGTTLNGERFAERKALTQTIARRVSALLGPAETVASVELVYRGVRFDINRSHGKSVHVSTERGDVAAYDRGAETFSATGLLTRMNNYIDRIDAEIVEVEGYIALARNDAERFKAEAAKPFDQVQALREAREQYRRVQRLLLVRGPEIPDHERPILDAALEAQRAALREVGFGDALDELLDYQNLRDDGTGSFSKRTGTAGRGASVAQVRRVVDEMMVGWKGAPVVRVVETPEHLPAPARRAPDYHLAEGYYAPSTGTVYLVASALPNRQAVQRVLLHEAVGHYGIEAIAGPALWAQIAEGVHRLREKGRHGRLFAEHARRGYLDNGWDASAIREFIAMMAESGVQDRLLDRLIAAVRAFLRRLGARWRLSEAELRQLIVRAARQIRIGGAPVATTNGLPLAVAFSRMSGFRSALLQSLERAEGAPRRGTAEQWQQWLDGVQRRGGFKQAERDWLDVDVWLSTRERLTGETRIAREALTEFVRAHQVRIGEQMIGGDTARFHAALDRLQAAGFEVEMPPSYGVSLLRDGEEVDERTLTEAQKEDFETLSAGMETAEPLVSGEGVYARYQIEGGRDYRELLLTFPAQPSSRNADEPYRSDHYLSVKNVLVHIRYNEREDVDGKRMLFIEEIQSDWHQHGRRYGYRPATDRKVAPDAPFKSTEDWTLLAIKRMVRMAAEQGFERIGWTTGAQQTSRYARGEQVDAIDYLPLPSGAYRIAGMKQGEVVREMEVPANLLSSLLGAKVAARVRAGEGERSPRGSTRGTPLRRLEALSLHLGDAGMGGYYDGIVPAVVNRWARPLGAQATTAKIRPRFRSPALEVHALDITPAMRVAVAEGLPLFSRRAPEAFLADVDAVVRQDEDATRLERARQWLRDSTPAKLKDASRKTWLGVLATNQLTELGSDYDPAIAGFSRQLDAMSADRNALLEEGADLAETVRRWAGKNKADAKRLFDLMHRATLEGVDPAETYTMLQFRYGGQLRDATRPNIREALKALREQMLGRGGDNKIDMMEEARRLRGMPEREAARKRIYPTLRAAWEDLSPEAQAFYRRMRNLYRDRSEQVEDALADRIEASEAPDGLKRKLVFSIRQQFESHRLQGVYFPLQRYGEYFIAAERDGEPVFLMLDSLSALERKEAAFQLRGFTIQARGRLRSAQAKDAPSGSFVADIIEKLRKAGVSEKTQDAVYQTYLQALPELSMRKHAIHRKGVAGFDPDALRAFAHHMAHGAHQLARLRFGHVLEQTLVGLRATQDLRRQSPEADTRAVVAMDAILGELDQRHQWVLNPQDSAMTNRLSSVGFVYFLGATPAAALVNLTQTAILTFPQLAAQYGPGKATRYLLRGLNESARTAGHAQKVLKRPDELKAHEALQKAGVLDKTQTHALMGLAEGGLATYSPKLARAMALVGWLFHTAEVLNREASGMAAYRLARDAGESFDAAVRFAADTITATHFNYSNANRARFLQAGPAKVVLMFKQYGLNMLWHLGRMGWKATKAESPEVKRLARRNLAGVLMMSGFFSGAMGLPMASLTIGAIDMIAHAFGDDDDPWDTEAEIRKFFAQFVGNAGAEVMMHGAANTLTGADIANRVELSQLLWRDADRELDGRDAYYAMMDNVAGPMFGIAKNFFVGTQLVAEGQVYRGVETMLPKALKDAMKALRYADEGVTSTRGDLVTETDAQDELLQLVGFTPAEVARQYAENRALKDRERHILDRRQALLAAYAMALRQDDQNAALEVRRKIMAFNKAYPEKPITGQTIRRSLKAREAYSERAEHGVAYDAVLRRRIAEEEGVSGEGP
ncbi:MAG: PLxRFG domain-containing protein [Pseudomonadota bacterium]